MWPYFVVFFLASFSILFNVNYSASVKKFAWLTMLTILVIFIGLRDRVGGDWYGYQSVFINITSGDHAFNITKFDIRSDYGFELIVWFMYNLGLNIYVLNFFLAFFFVFALNFFLQKQPNPALGLVVSIPYIITIISMGYIRQSIAFSFLLIALCFLFDNKKYTFLIFIILGAFFHKSVLIMSIIFIFARGISIKSLIFLLIAFIGIYFLFKTDFNSLLYNYLFEGKSTAGKHGVGLESSGAIYRVIIGSLIATIFIFFRNELTKNIIEKRIFLFFSLVSIIALFSVGSYSTFTDRILIFFTPLHIFTFSRISLIFKNSSYIYLINNSILSFYLLYYYVWLSLGNHSEAWLPYRLVH